MIRGLIKMENIWRKEPFLTNPKKVIDWGVGIVTEDQRGTKVKVFLLLSKLSTPYNEISSYGKRPKLDKNKLNSEFSELLQSKELVLQFK